MGTILKEVRLICVEQGANANHNKYYYGRYFDDGTAESEYGRVGLTSQKTIYPSHAALDAKVKGKAKKGYVELKTVALSGPSQTVEVKGDLLDIARKQIKTTSPQLDLLVSRLVTANIHTITSSTQINYNAATGLFSTPLGIVTLDGINEGRGILATCADYVEKKQWGKDLEKEVCKFLRIVPQDFGMKRLDVKSFLPDLAAIQKQGDILDSLASSYQALQTTPATDTKTDKPVESVFNVSLGLLDEQKEYRRIVDKYHATRKDQHVCKHLQVKQIYIVAIEANVRAFEQGKKRGTIHELWHGTKQANLLSILKSGLHVSPPSTARIAGKMFGNGVYFAPDSTKSLNYSYGYWDGTREKNCFMFLCDVAMGSSYVPRSGWESDLPRSGFDSTWARAGQSGVMNDECIVYTDNQFLLKYLVEFE